MRIMKQALVLAQRRATVATILVLFYLTYSFLVLGARGAAESPSETWSGILGVKGAKLRLEIR